MTPVQLSHDDLLRIIGEQAVMIRILQHQLAQVAPPPAPPPPPGTTDA